MQLTHAEAHRLIQLSSDERLDSQQRMLLSTHLSDCAECRDYAEEIKEVEGILVSVLKRQWNLRQPIPLSIGVLVAKRNSRATSNILVTRMAMITVVFIAFAFSAWQFIVAGNQAAGRLSAGVPPVPTPSVQSTRTESMLQSCKEIYYTVQENDTLENIADRFSISKEEIIAVNHLQSETINIGMELILPGCKLTPTGTIHPTRLATIYTPTINHIASTPSG